MFAALYKYLFPKKTVASGFAAISATLKIFIPAVEGFTSKPFWDYKQWSWGYGSYAGSKDPKLNPIHLGTITPQAALIEVEQTFIEHYNQLKPFVKVELTPNQWAALLSFSYNLGPGGAKNLMKNINAKNWSALYTQMRKYVYAGGKRLQGLVNRREKEIKLFATL